MFTNCKFCLLLLNNSEKGSVRSSSTGETLVYEYSDAAPEFRLCKFRNNNYEIITKTCRENLVFSSHIFWHYDKFMGSGFSESR